MNQTNSFNKWFLLLRLIIIGLVYQFQHYVFSFIAAGSTILEDLNISNFQYSILSGPCTLVVTALSIMPLSRSSEKLSRPVIFLLICVCLSGFLTFCTSFVVDFWSLFSVRVLFSLFSCVISPINLRILTNSFGFNLRGTSSSLYFLTIYLGLSLCSVMIYICSLISWRELYMIIGSCSLILSIIPAVSLISYKRTPKSSQVLADVKSLFENGTLKYSVIGLSFKYINQFIRASFESLYFSRAFPGQVGLYSILNTFFILVSPVSSIVFGRVSDVYESRVPNVKAVLCAVSFFVSAPLMIFMYLTSSFELAIAFLGISSLVSEAYIGVSYSIMINVTKPHLKAFQTAWMMSVTMIVGALSVVVVGFFYNELSDLRIALVSSAAISLTLAGVCFVKVGFVYQNDLKAFKMKEKTTDMLLNESI